MNAKDGDSTEDDAGELINFGGEIVGNVAGVAIGYLAAGLVGGVVGAGLGGGIRFAVSDVLKNVGHEISQRLLGPREKIRVGAAMAVCIADIQRRTDAGEKIRQDGFFAADNTGRSAADEVAEAVLLKAQREPEERKIAYMGHLLAHVAFAQVSPAVAHRLIKIGEQLTYRDLCILRLTAIKHRVALRNTDYSSGGPWQVGTHLALAECIELYHRGLIGFGNIAVLSMGAIVPACMERVEFGSYLYDFMHLEEIPDADVAEIEQSLR